MNAVSHHTKQLVFTLLKILFLVVIVCYIGYKLQKVDTETIAFLKATTIHSKKIYLLFLLCFVMAALNWFLEIMKWKKTVSIVKFVSFWQASKEALIAHALAILTPNRIGEFGVKPLFYAKHFQKKIVTLTLVSNSLQMSATVFFGLIGCIIVLPRTSFLSANNLYSLLFILIGVGFLVWFMARKTKLQFFGFSLKEGFKTIKQLSATYVLQLAGIAALRYLVFSFMFVLLLVFYSGSNLLIELFPYVFVMYFVASCIPTLFFTDALVKGGVSLLVFSSCNLPEIAILATVFTMWVFNFLIPGLAGSIYFLNHKPKWA